MQTRHTRVYRTPRLRVYGSLRDLTRTKRGTKHDGAGKPRTRAAGKPA